jgi:hypothetical protein
MLLPPHWKDSATHLDFNTPSLRDTMNEFEAEHIAISNDACTFLLGKLQKKYRDATTYRS